MDKGAKMKFFHIPFLILLTISIVLPLDAAHAVRLKDVASVQGVRSNQLVGYGLVVGLDGTGDGAKSPFTGQALVNMLDNMGIHVDKNDVKVKNVAGVMVTASLPPFLKNGQTIDVTLSTLGDAKSLQGGTLIATPLKALDGKVYAMAQGPISIGGFEADTTNNNLVQKNHINVARIPGGATVEKEVPFSLQGKEEIIFNLNNPDFTTMSRAMRAVDALLAGSYAKADDGATLHITIPEEYEHNQIGFLAAVENVDITPDVAARIIIDERTGTVVMGKDVQLKELAVAHGNLSVQVKGLAAASTVNNNNITARDKENKLLALEPGVTLGDLVSALNGIGVTTRDLIAILQSIKAAGALEANLEII